MARSSKLGLYQDMEKIGVIIIYLFLGATLFDCIDANKIISDYNF